MARAQRKQGDMRAQILDASTRLFAQRGFDGASLSAIASEVGIRKPSLLYHFESKEALRQAVLDRLLARWSAVLPDILRAATTGGRRFRALIGEIVAFFTEDPNRARLLLREMLDRPEEMQALLSEHVSPWTGILADYIRMGQGEGRLWAEIDPEAYLFNVIHHIVSGIAVSEVFLPLYGEGELTDEARARRLERHIEEMVRVAHASLFLPRTPQDA